MDLDRKHIKTLKKIANQRNIILWHDPAVTEFEYLRSFGLIAVDELDSTQTHYITEKGKAVLYEYRARLLEVWIPVIISNVIAVAALIISIIALLK